MEITIKWAPRVLQDLIRRLYKSDAKNIQDNELADEVGYGFYARAESIVKVNRAHNTGVAECPNCGVDVLCDANVYACKCGWQMAGKNYHDTYRKKQLVGGMYLFAEKFMTDWKNVADDYSKKMMAIDNLIHEFHWHIGHIDQFVTRPVAINFIEGRLASVWNLVIELASYDKNTYKEKMEKWLKTAKNTPWLHDLITKKEIEMIEKQIE